jgi:hypothetical protein
MGADEVFEYGYRHGRQVSHFLVDVTAYGRENLFRVLAVAFSDSVSREKRATHFSADGSRQLTLFARPPRSDQALAAEPFPEPLFCQQASEFVWDWLQRAEYQPDEHDGASEKGWRVFNERFGIVGGCWEAFVAIRPMWIYIPK